MSVYRRIVNVLVPAFLFASCATYDRMDSGDQIPSEHPTGRKIYLVGDAGKYQDGKKSPVLSGLHALFENSTHEDILLFLGDNIYPNGIPIEEDTPERKAAEASLQVQLDVAQKFNGRVFFIPGNHDWYSGTKGLKVQEKMVEDALGKNSFLPESGCPLDKYDVSEDIVIIFVDSEWYITHWDRHPDINDDCAIRTRENFIQEFKSLVNKNQNKTIILAIHHPLASHGSHGGQYAFRPLRIPLNFLLKTSGASPADEHFPIYRELSNKITTILQNHAKDVIVVSGHDHTLQYLEKAGIPQVISGSGSKHNAVRHFPKDTTTFGYGGEGYAVLHLEPDQTQIQFYNPYHHLLHSKNLKKDPLTIRDFSNEFPQSTSIQTSIYQQDDPDKTLRYQATDKHMYRGYYYNAYRYPVVQLDTLFGGLTPVKLGGGNQSVSLRMVNPKGREYVMRRVRKSATQFIQAKIFSENYVKDKLEGSVASNFLLDFYTSSYPFAPYVTGHLSEIAGVYHANSNIYFVPKQNALESYNKRLGNDLYLIEEHLSPEHKHMETLGDSDDIISSDDVLNDLRKDEKYRVDHRQYILTRLFDMWIGDWDRHEDQYKWAVTHEADGTITYAPIPRDRDQAFPKFGRLFTSVLTPLIPPLQSMQTFDVDIKNVIAFNSVIYRLDKSLIQSSELHEWLDAAEYLEQTLTDARIDSVFSYMPEQFDDHNLEDIIHFLKSRRQHISKWAEEYYRHLNKNVIITGTDKDDLFTVSRLPDGYTRIHVQRIKHDITPQDVLFDKTFHDSLTNEIWLYGLDDEDQFSVTGSYPSGIKVRLIGGQDHDTYEVENARRIKVYDYKSKKITLEGKGIKKYLTDIYDLNHYNFYKYIHHTHIITPAIASNPDEGVIIGGAAQFLKYGYDNHPFTHKHTLGAGYFTASNGFAIRYTGEWAHVLRNNNLKLESFYTTPAFSQNFFGYGNASDIQTGEGAEVYYRVRLERLKMNVSLINKGRLGTEWKISLPVDYYHPSSNEDRFVEDYFTGDELSPNVFAGIETSFSYENKNQKAFATQGMSFDLKAGWKQNLEVSEGNFGYLTSTLQVDYPLTRDKQFCLSTAWHVHANFNDGYGFYQAAVLGGRYGLRGYPNQRFSGQTAYYQNTDLRMAVIDFNAGVLPATLGIYAGFDYGRVWLPDENSKRWHTSYGGGLFMHSLQLLTLRASLFASEEGSRFVFGIGFDF